MNSEYDPSKVRVTVGDVEIQSAVVMDSLTAEYEAAFNEGRVYWTGNHEAAGVPPKTFRERGWKWRR